MDLEVESRVGMIQRNAPLDIGGGGGLGLTKYEKKLSLHRSVKAFVENLDRKRFVMVRLLVRPVHYFTTPISRP